MAYTQERSKTDAVAEAFNIKVPILPGVNDCDSVVSDCALRIILSHSYLNKLFANIAKGLRAIALTIAVPSMVTLAAFSASLVVTSIAALSSVYHCTE